MKLIVELIRHGETDLQAQRRYQGSIDVPLSREGRQRLSAGRENLSALREARNAGGVFSPVGGVRLPAEGAFADREKKFPENTPASIDG